MTLAGIVAAILALVGGLFAFGRTMKKAGKNEGAGDREKANEKLRKKYDEIESRKPNLDDAIDRLRKRAGRDGGTDPK
jgi:hypothetical protein